ncbi:conserved hypothetical protein [Ricinus communis]|uniref:Uncharacterized protein n=1 Tax=Ricinus communis TaxID=3988 RepID=B9SWM1_RICCO|nr:conserved hypothetical protein [Ricinus communis]
MRGRTRDKDGVDIFFPAETFEELESFSWPPSAACYEARIEPGVVIGSLSLAMVECSDTK